MWLIPNIFLKGKVLCTKAYGQLGPLTNSAHFTSQLVGIKSIEIYTR